MKQKTKMDLIYTIIGVLLMVPIMTIFNKYLVYKEWMEYPLTTATFWYQVLIGILQRLPVVFPLQFFLVQKFSEKMVEKHTREDDDIYYKMAARTAFSIIILCPVLSLYANLLLVFEGYLTNIPAFINNWIPKMIVNWPFAFMVQVFVAGPLNRGIFLWIIARRNKRK